MGGNDPGFGRAAPPKTHCGRCRVLGGRSRPRRDFIAGKLPESEKRKMNGYIPKQPKQIKERIEAKLDEQNLERQRVQLRLAKESLAREQRQIDLDIANTEAWLDGQRQTREQSLVRSPTDGVVAEILARVGETATSAGIAKVINMGQLRVIADVDEINVNRIAPGGKVEMTFRGDPALYKGTIARIAPTVKRMQKLDPGAGSSTDARTIEVEIEFDDRLNVPEVLGREARITFL